MNVGINIPDRYIQIFDYICDTLVCSNHKMCFRFDFSICVKGGARVDLNTTSCHTIVAVLSKYLELKANGLNDVHST